MWWVDFPRGETEPFRYAFFEVAADGTERLITQVSERSMDSASWWDVPEDFSGSLRAQATDQGGTIRSVVYKLPIRTMHISGVLEVPFICCGDGSDIVIEGGVTLPITWTDFPPDAARYGFFSSDQVLIGEDSDSSDGVQVQWAVPPDFLGALYGEAYDEDGTLIAVAPSAAAGIAANTPTPTEVGYLEVFFTDVGDYYLVPSGEHMSLYWQQAPRSRTETFHYTFFQVTLDGTKQVIGTAADDGYTPFVWWDVPSLFEGVLYAEATDETGTIRYVAYVRKRLRALPVSGQIDMPYLFGDAGMISVASGETIPVTWKDFPPDAARYVLVNIDDQSVLAEATDSSDGVVFQWDVPIGFSGQTPCRSL